MLTKQQIQQICEEIQQNTQVQGILLAGSYVYGTPHEDSDLDVRMVTNDGSNWTDQETRKFGTRLHAYYNPPEVVRYYFEMKRNVSDPPTIHLWSYGEIVYDPNGIVAQLQQEARQIWKEGCEQGIWIPREKYRDRAVITKKEHEQRW